MIGRTFSGRYRIVERIGIGGMAEVYRAQDTVLGRIVAVKVMLPQYAADTDFTRRFRQEAASAANLQSPYIVNIYDWGQDEGTYYIVMEYVRGGDLKTAIKERGAINQRKVAEIASQACQALSVAHHMDIVHRDVKPQNIMVQPDGNVKMMDFGIARAKNSVKSQTSSVLGTAHYISPEQAQGKELTAASDIYSLGVCMYEAITGKLPFDGPDAVSVAMKQVNEQPRPLHEIFPSVDPVLEAIVLRAMAKEPARRFATALDMRQVLNDYLSGRARGEAAAQAILAGGLGVPSSQVSPSNTDSMTRVINPNGEQRTTIMNGMGAPAPMPPANQTSVMAPPQTQNGGWNAQGTGPQVQPGTKHRNVNGTTQEKPKKSKGPVIIVVLLLLALLGAGGAYAYQTFFNNTGTIPNVVGKNLEQATATLEESGYTVGETTEVYSDTADPGLVVSSDPEAGMQIDKGTSVNLTLSKGKEQVVVPDVTNWREDDAAKTITESGLKPKAGTAEHSTTVEKGVVIRTSPAGGTTVDKGSTVTYVVSLGPDTKEIPNVYGQSQDAAWSNLTNAGFNVSIREDYSDELAEGLVIAQYPEAGTTAERDSTVEIVISLGQHLVTVPNVVGETVADAYSILNGAGFEVTQSDSYSNSAIVTSQSVAGEVTEGTVVNITAKEPEQKKSSSSSESSSKSSSSSSGDEEEEDEDEVEDAEEGDEA